MAIELGQLHRGRPGTSSNLQLFAPTVTAAELAHGKKTLSLALNDGWRADALRHRAETLI